MTFQAKFARLPITGRDLQLGTFAVVLFVAGSFSFEQGLGSGSGNASGPTDPTAVALGRAYAPVLSKTYAESWIAAAKALEEGKSVEESQRILQDTWKDARIRAFRNQLEPAFAKVLKEGDEPANNAERIRVANFWRSFATGLRNGR